MNSLFRAASVASSNVTDGVSLLSFLLYNEQERLQMRNVKGKKKKRLQGYASPVLSMLLQSGGFVFPTICAGVICWWYRGLRFSSGFCFWPLKRWQILVTTLVERVVWWCILGVRSCL